MSRFGMIRWLIVGCLVVGSGAYQMLQAQDSLVVDSLLQLVHEEHRDTAEVNALRELFWEHKRVDPAIAKDYLDQSLELATALNFKSGIARGLYAMGGFHQIAGEFAEARTAFATARDMFAESGDSIMRLSCILDIGLLYQIQGQYLEATELIIEAVEGFERQDDNRSLARAYNTLGILYYGQNDYVNALKAYQNALEKCKQIDLEQGIAVCYGNIATALFNLERYDEALSHFYTTLEYQQKLGDRVGMAKSYNNMGLLYNQLGENVQALTFHQKAFDLYSQLGYQEGLAISQLNIGLDFHNLSDYVQAIHHYERSLEMAEEYDFKETQVKAYGGLADVYSDLHQFDKAYHYSELHRVHGDSLQNEINADKVTELEARYQTAEKEKQISLLNQTSEIQSLRLRRTRTLNYIGSAATLLGAILIFLLFRHYKHRRSIREMRARQKADQQIIEMEQQLLNAVIITEEKERKRFSADLHDEMGPLLSSIRLYLEEIPEVTGEERDEMVKYTQELVDQAIQDVRSISNNIMPVSISEHGLVHAVTIFGQKVERTKAIKLHLSDTTQGKRFPPAIDVVLYRVIIELINNTLKHSGAQNIYIDFTCDQNTISITYRDDGTGFDTAIIDQSAAGGRGLKNIIDRITSINGRIDITSHRAQGILVNIQIKAKHE